ncbi:MAG: hypothetical protein QM634_14085, partial [Gordonia sp. (in: high G+C Gram-positive bacteria)]
MLLSSVAHRRGGADRLAPDSLTAPPAFDIPAGCDPNRGDDAVAVGVRWVSDTLVTAVRVDPVRPVPRAHSTAGTTPLGDEASVDLAVLQRFRQSCRGAPTLDLTVTDHRYCGAGPLAAAYRATLGPLPIATSRRVVVVVRTRAVDPGAPAAPDPRSAALRSAA